MASLLIQQLTALDDSDDGEVQLCTFENKATGDFVVCPNPACETITFRDDKGALPLFCPECGVNIFAAQKKLENAQETTFNGEDDDYGAWDGAMILMIFIVTSIVIGKILGLW